MFLVDLHTQQYVANVVTQLLERTCYVDKHLQAADQSYVADPRDLAALCRPGTAVAQMEDPHNGYKYTHKCMIDLSSCLGNTSCDSSATSNQILNA